LEISTDGNESPASYFRVDEGDLSSSVILVRKPFDAGSSFVELPQDVSSRNLAMYVILRKIKDHRGDWETISISPSASGSFLDWWQTYSRQGADIHT